MARNTVSAGVGLRAVYIAKRDDDGTFSVPTAVSAGDAYYGIKAHRSQALTVMPADPTLINLTGDDVAWATFVEAPDDSPSGELRTQVEDTALVALITSVKEVTSGYRLMTAMVTDKLGSEDAMIVWGSRKAKTGDPDEATSGNDSWESRFFLNATLYAKPAGFEEKQAGSMTWAVTANKSTLDFLGQTLTEATNGCTEACWITIHTTYKPFYETFEGDGIETEFTLTQGADVIHDTEASPITCTVDGVERAVTVDAVGLMTVSGAVVAADGKIAVFYEYDN